MAVSLVSTGITFPDSTTQTTAAGASPTTTILSNNFSGQSSVSWALDFATYPGGYEMIWSRVVPTSSNVILVEYSVNSGSSYSAMASYNVSTTQTTTAWAWSNNASGYFAYYNAQWQNNATGFTMNVSVNARSASSTSALTLSGQGFMSASNPVPIVAFGYHFGFGTTNYTNIRFTAVSGTFSGGSLRVLGIK
jgi:hypothetical protein